MKGGIVTVTPQPSFIAKLIISTYNYNHSTKPISTTDSSGSNYTFKLAGKDYFSVTIHCFSKETTVTIHSQDADPDDILKIVHALESKFDKKLDITLY
jgi:hypothetical protein